MYLGASWVILEVTATLQDVLSLPEWTAPVAFVLLLSGLLVILATAWAQSHPALNAREAAGDVPDSWEIEVRDIGRSIREGRLPHLTWARAIVGGAFVFSLLFGFAGLYVLLRETGTGPGPAPLAAESGAAPGVAVVPFSVSAPELELWREGLVDLLSTNLDGPGGLRGIDSRTVLARWSESVPDDTRPDLSGMLAVARDAGGTWAVVGSLVGTSSAVRLSADVYEVGSGAKLGTARAEGAAADIMALVDQLSVEVVRLLLGEETGRDRVQHLSALTTPSLPALQAYLEGEAHYRRSEFQQAVDRFRAAVEEDSVFALAWLRLHDAYGWTDVGGEAYNESAAVAYRHRSRLPARNAILVEARQATAAGSIAALDELRDATRRYPDDPELWHELGEHYVHFAGQLADAPDTALAVLQKAIALDPSFGPYYIHAVDLAIITGDSARAAGLLGAQGTLTPASSYHIASSLAFDLAFGTDSTREQAWREVETGDPEVLDWAPVGLLALRHIHLRERLSRTLYRRGAETGFDVVHSVAGQGRIRDAAALHEQEGIGRRIIDETLAALRAARLHVPDPLLQSDAADGDAPAVVFARAVHAVDEQPDRLQAVRSEIGRRGQAALAAGDTVEARRWSALDRAVGGYAAWRLEDEPQTALAQLEEARAQITGWVGSESSRWVSPAAAIRLWLGELHAELGQPERAARYFRSLYYETVLHAFARYRLGEMYERLDRLDEARSAYATFVDAWAEADPELQPLVEDARRRLAALMAEG